HRSVDGRKLKDSLVTERQILDDAIGVRFVHHRHLAEGAAPFGAFRGQQMTFAGVGTEHLAARGDFEALGHRFLGFNAFWATHKMSTFVQLALAIYEDVYRDASGFLALGLNGAHLRLTAGLILSPAAHMCSVLCVVLRSMKINVMDGAFVMTRLANVVRTGDYWIV